MGINRVQICVKLAVVIFLLPQLYAQQLTAIDKSLPPAVNHTALSISAPTASDVNQKTRAGEKAGVFLYAVANSVRINQKVSSVDAGGEWLRRPDGNWVWRLRVQAEGALSLDFAFKPFHLPSEAELYIYDESKSGEVLGPFTEADNRKSGSFWTPIIQSSQVIIDVRVSDQQKPYLELALDQVNYGYRNFEQIQQKSQACNIDVACPLADDYRQQVNSVARYSFYSESFQQQALCTGQLINNTENDNKPLFVTAHHCISKASEASTMVVYWKYESEVCRTDSSSGIPLPVSGFPTTQSGGTLLTSNAPTDWSLIELDAVPPADAFAFWSGWDIRSIVPSIATAIHHPDGDEKRISQESTDLEITMPIDGAILGSPEADTHIRIGNWDAGTTSNGSSGGGLWNGNGHLIGVLSGGFSGCSPVDYYGHLAAAYDRNSNGFPIASILDPNNMQSAVVDGIEACDAPIIAINFSTNPAQVGDDIQISADVSGGVGPYTYAWDINGDEVIDSTDSFFTTRYSAAYNENVLLKVTDSRDCVGSRSQALAVAAPALVLESVSQPIEVCGNGDAAIDPGERWALDVSMKNNGLSLAKRVEVSFSKGGAFEPKSADGGDALGYVMSDQNGPSCRYSFVDISATGQDYAFTAASPLWDAIDDGITDAVELGTPMDFYEESFDALYMSSNGYLTSNSEDTGEDFSPDCPIPTKPIVRPGQDVKGDGGRLYVYHDDFITNQAYHQSYEQCPRANSFGQTDACDIFQWDGVNYHNVDPNSFGGDMQAIIYGGGQEIVYQYKGDFSDVPGSNFTQGGTVGIQNKQFTVGVQNACGLSSVKSTRDAVCILRPDAIQSLSRDSLILDDSVLNFGDIGVGQSAVQRVFFSINPSANCGESIAIRHLGSHHDQGYNAAGNIIYSTQLGSANSCSIVNSCPTPQAKNSSFNEGLYWNSQRSGNGLDAYAINDDIVLIWYTSKKDRSPVWYLGQGPLDRDQGNLVMQEFRWDNDQAIGTVVGEASVTLSGTDSILLDWTVNGESGGEQFNRFSVGQTNLSIDYTGLWYSPSNSGWGWTLSDQASTRIAVVYYYDLQGNPVWALGNTSSLANPGTDSVINMASALASCPNCPWIAQTSIAAGSIRVQLNSQTEGMISTQLESDTGLIQANWLRSNINTRLLSIPK